MQKTTITLIDDLDGTPIPEGKGGTIRYAFEGQEYEVDLSDENRGKLYDELAPFIGASRKIAKKGRPAAAKPSTTGKAGK